MAERKSTSQRVGASTRYTWSRFSSRRKASWEMRVTSGPIVRYRYDQSTERLIRVQSSRYSFSSSTVSAAHSSMKLGRETGIGFLGGLAGGRKSGAEWGGVST